MGPGESVPGARIEIAEGETRLVLDGAVQSVSVRPGERPRGYWGAMLPEQRPASVLVLGLGGGTFVHLLWDRFGRVPVVGVDDDGTVLELGRQHFGLDAPELTVVQADAGEYVRACRRRFALVIVDIYRGERLPEWASRRAFIRRVRGLAEPGGTVVWNLHRDRRGRDLRRRAGAGLLLERRVLAGLNLVLHFRRKRLLRISLPNGSPRR